MNFHSETFAQRFAAMGDEAENKCMEVWPTACQRWGWNRPTVSLVGWPPMIRHVPDFITSNELVEAIGFGRDQTLKLKAVKLQALLSWNALLPVKLFLWDSHNKRWAAAPLSAIYAAALASPVKEFHDGGAYHEIAASSLEVDWSHG